ncbi:MAG: 3-hydroxyacyl-CoA dehydrogenase family protein [Micromonosporaceae bacterium]|nr:3-hydroxyacyl-CoA dehydrogenase family protein [Micromonosporaceae bacterium]
MTEGGPTAAFAGQVAILGAGTMGQGIATACVNAGLATVVADIDPAALERARAGVARRVARRDGADAAALDRLRLTVDLEDAVAHAAAVIEAVPEVAELKYDVFRRLSAAAPDDAVLASNTSTMSISRLAQASTNPSRVIGMHFFNPAHRMPLVELVTGRETDPATLRDALDLARTLGKEPIVVRDVPGFVTSRLGLLLGTEAMRMVEENVAAPGDIDKAMRLGYGHPMGPLELADLVGLDARLNNLRSMFERSGAEQYRPPAILERLVAQGRLGRKTGSGFYTYDDAGRITGPAPGLQP